MQSKSKIYKLLSSLNGIKWKIAFHAAIGGIIAGFLVVLYRMGIAFGTSAALKIYAYLKPHPLLILIWLVLIAAAGLIIALLLKFEPMAGGSGIPQVEGTVIFGLKTKWYAILPVRFAAGILSSFFGLSLGREGPSIQIGACGSEALSKKLNKNKLEENYIITGGAAAGLSAAFNAPLSGIVFALEEVHRSFSPRILIAAATASLAADAVSKYFFGLKPVLSFSATPQLAGGLYLWMIPLGILSGIAGALMNKVLLGFQSLYKKLPLICRPFLALLIALPVGLYLPQVLGGGQNLIKLSQSADNGLLLLFILFTVKMLFTSICFGSGTPGGIFMPILSVGALAGAMLGITASHFGMPDQYIADFVVCAMAGALSSSVKAPVTSILLIAEMTGSLVHLLPVAICSFIALFISDAMKTTPIYEALLERIMDSGEINREETKALMEIPVELGSIAAGKLIRDISWPEGVLIVGIHRGEKELIPQGDTKIIPGDYLVVLSSEKAEKDLKISIQEYCHT